MVALPTLHDLFDRFGVVIVFVNTLLHELAVPLPLTPTLLVAGAISSEIRAVSALVAAVVAGTVIGNAVWFAAGRRFGGRVLGFLCRFSLSPDSCVARSADGFSRWGGTLFIVGRFVPGISLVAPPVAGALGMRWSKFLALTALGAAFWAVVVIVIGAALEEVVIGLLKALATLPAGLWLGGAALLVSYVAWRFMLRRRAALDVPKLPPAQLLGVLQSPKPPVVIDVRGETMRQIQAERIPGAIALSLDELRHYPIENFAGRDTVLYCSCPNDASAAAGVRILRSRGQLNPKALRGGLDAWTQAGYAVESAASHAPPA
jgi:membrane protein DedA with SNARE-associated domain/rhodanese-related sulfurtransferase